MCYLTFRYSFAVLISKKSCTWGCWRWPIEERVDEFVIEKYIEISAGTVYADPDPRSYSVTIQ